MEGIIVRRVIPSDNNCLFNAVGYVMDRDMIHMTSQLRMVASATVFNNPEKFQAVVFPGKSDYIPWILESENQGGALELSILADHFGREIAVYDTRNSRCVVYGQDRKFKERVMLIYDGRHYDALAVNLFEEAPEENDKTIFKIHDDGTVGLYESLALNFVEEQRRNRMGISCCGVQMLLVVSATVFDYPAKFSHAVEVLGKPNYISWILDHENKGGAFELSILSDYFGREIAVYDTQDSRTVVYGRDRMFSERVMLIYDGLHYDALALSLYEGALQEFDQTVFNILSDRTIGHVERLALKFVKGQQMNTNVTETVNFTLRCGVCQVGVKDEKEAVDHAEATGHVKFLKYN